MKKRPPEPDMTEPTEQKLLKIRAGALARDTTALYHAASEQLVRSGISLTSESLNALVMNMLLNDIAIATHGLTNAIHLTLDGYLDGDDEDRKPDA